jgi:adenosylcobinamide-GDP ribazoletransferase
MRAALAFLTPFPGARPPTPRALRWFPLVGLALGFALGGLWWATAKIWPLPVAAFIVVLADLGLTGMLHLDGLADTADGLLPHLSRERRLEVMREPTVGAFGMGAGTAMAAVVDRVPFGRRESGLPGAFMGAPLPVLGVVAVVLAAAALAAAWKVPAGPVAVASSAVAFGAVVFWARHRIGGYTGDVLGAAGMVAETIGLVVAAARW